MYTLYLHESADDRDVGEQIAAAAAAATAALLRVVVVPCRPGSSTRNSRDAQTSPRSEMGSLKFIHNSRTEEAFHNVTGTVHIG